MAANLLPIFVYTLKYGRLGGLIVVVSLLPVTLLGYFLLGGMAELYALTNKFWAAQVSMLPMIYLLGWNIELRQRIQRELAHAKNLQHQLLTEKNRALAANKDKDDLLTTISHDLRTPVSGIIQSAQLLEHALPDDTRAQIIRNIQTSGHQLLQVVNDLLNLYRQDAQALAEAEESFDLREQIRDIVRLVRPLFEAKRLTLDRNIAANVPPFISGHPKRLRQTLFNLLGNSLKYTVTGGVTLEVSVDPEQALMHHRHRYWPRNRRRAPAILDGSYRFSPTPAETIQSSYGLGLSHCLKMVAAIDGELAIASTLRQKAPRSR
ncbi:MAG: HAMP domain-containing sensor histidine kinase [Candidatus Competibacteraceae bacterium]